MESTHRYWLIVSLVFLSVVSTACAGSVVAQDGEPTTAPTLAPAPESGVDLGAAFVRLQNYDGRRSFQTTRIYDRRGKLLDEVYGEGRRSWVALDEVPEALKQATIATEDQTFYRNSGVDPLAIGRAALQNFQAGTIVSGGSTITQQLVRLIVFPYAERVKKTMSRKVNESLLATRLTRMWSKDKILEAYLNEIYYGHQAYGVAAAAETYFDKPVSSLTLAESALLAGLPQAPSLLDPHENFEAAKRRQKQVLRLMVEAGYLTQPEADAAHAAEITLELPGRVRQAPHFVDYVQQVLEDAYGRDTVRQGGLRVTTSLDMRYQRLAEEIARRHVGKMRDAHNLTNAAVVIMQPQTGQILAMVGSVDFDDPDIDGQVNVALSPRQPGSAIKPITYAAAFEQGLTPASIVWDIPTTFPLELDRTYQPTNYDDAFHGPLRLRDALANSYNVPAVKVLKEIGLQTLVDKAHAMGVTGLQRDPYRYYGLSLTLGGGEVSLLGLTNAYATLANGGGFVPRTPILEVIGGTGDTLYAYQRAEPQPAVDPAAAFLVTHILADRAARTPAFGHDNPLVLSRPAAAKTGTTTDFRDNWALGYTPQLVVGVWTGNADNTPMKDVSGIDGAAPLWHDVMETIFRIPALQDVLRVDDQPLIGTFEPPAGVDEIEICNIADLRAGRGCQTKHRELIQKDVIPDGPVPATIEQPTDKPPELGQASDEEAGASLFCRVSDQAGVSREVFLQMLNTLTVPPDKEEAARIQAWAAEHGVPLTPNAPCEPGGMARVPGGAPALINATWRITSPAPGELITDNVPIIGTASFSPNDVSFYKVEFAPARAPLTWVTMGQTHSTPIVDGELEAWYAAGLEPGSYTLRLVLVKPDGNWAPPYEVPVRVGR
ncbi:MAG: Penicillin-binding protein 2D [Anaerolineales bacterium]|nr:Penicillin-binding protein 2D [Anaerolineales bacterium]